MSAIDQPSLERGTAIKRARDGGEIAEYLGSAAYLGAPGARIRRIWGVDVIPDASIGTEWVPVPGRVVVIEHETGRWTTPVERRLGVLATEPEVTP